MSADARERRAASAGRQAGDRAPAAVPPGGERRVTVQVGRWFGVDLRPSRTFVWAGERGLGLERVVSFGRRPRLLRAGRLPRRMRVGSAEVTYLGSPVVTVPLAAYEATRLALAARRRRD
jgi:hypothetical protein